LPTVPVCGLEGGIFFAINAKPCPQGKAAIAAGIDCGCNDMRAAAPKPDFRKKCDPPGQGLPGGS